MNQKLLAAFSAALLTLSALTPAAAAARTVPVTVDGALLSGTSYLEQGVTHVPLRSLCEALGGWSVFWDAALDAAIAQKANALLTVRPGEPSLLFNGAVYDAPAAYLKDGRTYVPLRAACELLELEVGWDAALGGAAVRSGRAEVWPEEDLYWLFRIISAESRGESLEGQIAVGSVVLNRVAAREFPNTVREVVFDRKNGVQFEPVSNGTVYDQPAERSVAAAKAVLSGSRTVGACLYFYAPALSQGLWINANRPYYTTIGCHRFYL